jgi:peptidoglycan/xylan/chitin deacetylase (PgdA/CDA1 family)
MRTLSKIEKTIGHKQDVFPLTTLRRSEIALLKDDSLISFGAHTHSHVDLGKVNASTAKSEIRTSKEEVEKTTGKRCLLFSYPFGKKKNLTSQVKALLRTEGFSGAVTAIPGAIYFESDLFELKRIAAVNDAALAFKCALVGFTLQRS